MTLRLFFVTAYYLADAVFFLWAMFTKDGQKRQTRLLFAIYFSIAAIGKILAAVAIHTGAFPLWNNK